MADLYAVVKNALDKQVDKSPRIRGLVYTKAREALEKKMSAFNPPLSAQQVAAQREKLESAIDAIESEYAQDLASIPSGIEVEETLALGQTIVAPEITDRNRPVFPQPPSFAQPDVQETYEDAEQGFDPQEANDPTFEDDGYDTGFEDRYDDPMGMDDDEQINSLDRLVDQDDDFGEASQSEFGLIEDDDGGDLPYGEEFEAGDYAEPPQKSRTGLNLFLAVLILSVLAVAGFMFKDQIQAAFSDDEPAVIPASETITDMGEEDQVEDPAEPENAPMLPDIREIIPADPEPVDTGENIQDSTITPIDDTAAEDLPKVETEETTQAETEDIATDVAQNESLEPVQVKASLFEQNTQSNQVKSYLGGAKWQLETSVSADTGEPTTAVRAEINLLQERNMLVLLKIEKNFDPDLPASHTIEVVFDVPPTFDGGQISKMGLITARSDMDRPPTPIQGLIQSVTDGYFLVALPDTPIERQTNLKLLRDAPLLEIRLEYKSGQPAVLRIEKTQAVQAIFDQAFRNWGDVS